MTSRFYQPAQNESSPMEVFIMKKSLISGIVALSAFTALTVSANAAFLSPTGASASIAMNGGLFEEDKGETWIKIANPFNEYTIYSIGEISEDTKDIIICFDATDCDGSYTARTGFGINDWTPSVWSAEDYEKIGGVPEYVIDHDGSYQMTVPFAEFMKVTPFEDEETGEDFYKENLEKIDCLELCISGVTAESKMVVTITDVLQSPAAHTAAECELHASAADSSPSADSSSDSAGTETPDTASTADKGSPDTGVEGVAPVVGLCLAAAASLFIARKR